MEYTETRVLEGGCLSCSSLPLPASRPMCRSPACPGCLLVFLSLGLTDAVIEVCCIRVGPSGIEILSFDQATPVGS